MIGLIMEQFTPLVVDCKCKKFIKMVKDTIVSLGNIADELSLLDF